MNFLKLCCYFTLFLLPALIEPLYADDIKARAAIIMDRDSGKILYAKNKDLKQPPASTTKLVTAMVVLDKLKTDRIVVISKRAANTESAGPRLKKGEKYRVQELLEMALVRSVNGATVALAEKVSGSEWRFARLMNEKAKSLGARNTRFINASGLPGKGQYITAYDLAKIMKASLEYPVIKKIINTKTKRIKNVDGRKIYLKNTNKMLWKEKDVIGGKTGYTRAARHCLAFAAEKGEKTLVAALLGDYRRRLLWSDAKRLLKKGVQIVSNNLTPVVYASSGAKKKGKNKKARSARVSVKNYDSTKVKVAAKSKGETKKSIHVQKNNKRALKARLALKDNKQRSQVRIASKKKDVKSKL